MSVLLQMEGVTKHVTILMDHIIVPVWKDTT